MQYTTNYNLITVEGTDVVNPLVQMNPNFTDIDSIMKDNADATVARATCTKTGTTHAVVTTNSDAAMQRFTATGNWETGDTMTIDGVTVSVYLPDGTAPQTGCFVINSEVIIAINGTRVTLYCAPALSQSASDISYDNTLSGLSASDVQDALDELAAMPKGMNCLAVITTDAGCTVNIQKGGTTISATEVSSGVYEAVFDEYGTWTVNNVTLGYSRTFTVDVVKIYNLSFIPDGRTITPVNDVQTLLHCAGIFDKGYTVLSQLLADTASLYSIITDNNAIDYLVRSTAFASGITGNNTAMNYIGSDNYASNTLLGDATWLTAICNSTYFESILNVKVPTMTTNTTPAGYVASVSSQYDGNKSGFAAFDNDPSTSWITNVTNHNTPCWIDIEFPAAVKGFMYSYDNNAGLVGFTQNFKVQGSNDGNTYYDLTDTLNEGEHSRGGLIMSNTVNSSTYTHYRLYINSQTGNGSYTGYMSTLQFYGREDV